MLHGKKSHLLLLLLLGHLGGLAAHLTGTSQGAVHLTCSGRRQAATGATVSGRAGCSISIACNAAFPTPAAAAATVALRAAGGGGGRRRPAAGRQPARRLAPAPLLPVRRRCQSPPLPPAGRASAAARGHGPRRSPQGPGLTHGCSDVCGSRQGGTKRPAQGGRAELGRGAAVLWPTRAPCGLPARIAGVHCSHGALHSTLGRQPAPCEHPHFRPEHQTPTFRAPAVPSAVVVAPAGRSTPAQPRSTEHGAQEPAGGSLAQAGGRQPVPAGTWG